MSAAGDAQALAGHLHLRIMFDLIGELLELVFSAGGLPGFDSLEAQRRARIVAATVAFVAILGGHFILGPGVGTVVFGAGLVVALWVLAFSLVDLTKERPTVSWASVVAIFVASAGLTTAIGLAVLGR